jgi:hypothetical protein
MDCKHIELKRVRIGNVWLYMCANKTCGALFRKPQPFEVTITSGAERRPQAENAARQDGR